jgi:hypothetical protein
MTKTIKVNSKNDILVNENTVGNIYTVIDENGIYWGEYKVCKNWCREIYLMEYYDSMPMYLRKFEFMNA